MFVARKRVLGDVSAPFTNHGRVNPEGETQFAGWARMAQVITAFSVVEVCAYVCVCV